MGTEGAVDLDAYFARVEWGGAARPTYDTLAGLVRAHMRTIPFENLDVLLGRGVRLDLASLQSKLVLARRGGYCFEHATLFAAVLSNLGFRFACHSARVVLRAPRNEVARTHMFLTVALPEGTFVLDPGFGSLAPEYPVPLAHSDAADAAHSIARDGAYFVLRARTDGKIVDCWASTLEADTPMDFAVANHYTATHPASAFVNNIMLRALTDDGRIAVINRTVTLEQRGATRSWELADRAALRELLVEHFGFDLPEAQALRVPAIEEWA